MKKIFGFITVAALILTSVLLLVGVSAAEQDYYIYTAEDITSRIEASNDINYTYETRDGSSFVNFKIKSAPQSGTYLRFNLCPNGTSDASFVPEFKAKDYPIVVVSCKTNIVNTSSTLAANAGLKITSTGKYERCWALNSKTALGTAQTSGVLTKTVFDLTSFSGYDGGSAKWSDVDANSGLKYFRIAAWNKTASTANYASEYFDIEYIGVFKTLADAEAFSITEYRKTKKNTVELYDENGDLIETYKVKSGDTLKLPKYPGKSGQIFVGWENKEVGSVVSGAVEVYSNLKLTATYAECLVYGGDAISAWASVSNFKINTTCFDDDGNSYVKVSTPDTLGTYGNNDFVLFTLGESIKAADYPIVAVGYRSTITDHGNWALSVSLKVKSSGNYSRFWGLSDDHVNGGTDQKAVFDVRKVSGGDAGVNYSGVAADSDIKYLRLTPYGSNFGVEKTPGQYFDITYIAFFKSEAAARAFNYDPFDAAAGDETHNAFMLRDTDFAFRPTENLTRAEAASALARILVNYNSIAGKYKSYFSDVDEDAWYYDEVAYLERLGYIGSGASFNPDSDITKGELADWLEAANNAGEDVTKYPGTYTASSKITRSEAAKVLCQIAGRTPTADGIRYASTAYFSDVDKSTANYAYIVEAVYTHTLKYDSKNNEKWLAADDNDFYISKASDDFIAELDALYDKRVAEIRATESEYTVRSGKKVYYVSPSGNDGNNWWQGNSGDGSKEKPYKSLSKIQSLQDDGTIKWGDVVLLERGGEYRISDTFRALGGVTYSAYGEGDKPRVIVSTDASSSSKWSQVNGYPGLYVFNQTFNVENDDIGNIVFNDGEMYGQRVIKELNNDRLLTTGRDNIVGNGRDFWELDISKYEFKDYTDIMDIVNDQKAAGKNPDLIYFHYWDEYTGGNDKLYLYCAKGNPGTVFDSIELCRKDHVVYGSSDVTIDNWALFYGASHGVAAGTSSNFTVRNCEIGWIGGAVQWIDAAKNEIVRFGNGIEVYGGANGFYAYNNYIYQCFDCGPTVQWSGTLSEGQKMVQQNVEFYDNVLFDSALEVWLSTTTPITSTTYAKLINCKMYNNLVKGAGYGFAGYNHQKNEPCQFYGGGTTSAPYENCVMENNIFWGSKVNILKCNPTSTVNGQGFLWRNNTIVHMYDGKLGSLGTDTKTASGKTTWYNYNNAVLKHLLSTETFGYNDFMYTLSEGQADPYEAHLANIAEKTDLIEIATAEDLLAIKADGNYMLTADIDLDGIAWTPVGTEATPFVGTFDGNGFVISNLSIDTSASASLFGVCNSATITDVTVEDADIIVNATDSDVYAAVIAHKAYDKTIIKDCEVSGEVTVTTEGDAYAAGLCAYNASSSIVDSVSDASIIATAGEKAYVAGVCAYLYSDASLSGCSNKGARLAEANEVYNGGIYAEMKADTVNSSLRPSTEGCVDLFSGKPGDVNGDGRISSLDVVALTRALANWGGYENYANPELADFDGDGTIGLLDIVHLARHIAGWKGYEDLFRTAPVI